MSDSRQEYQSREIFTGVTPPIKPNPQQLSQANFNSSFFSQTLMLSPYMQFPQPCLQAEENSLPIPMLKAGMSNPNNTFLPLHDFKQGISKNKQVSHPSQKQLVTPIQMPAFPVSHKSADASLIKVKGWQAGQRNLTVDQRANFINDLKKLDSSSQDDFLTIYNAIQTSLNLGVAMQILKTKLPAVFEPHASSSRDGKALGDYIFKKYGINGILINRDTKLHEALQESFGKKVGEKMSWRKRTLPSVPQSELPESNTFLPLHDFKQGLGKNIQQKRKSPPDSTSKNKKRKIDSELTDVEDNNDVKAGQLSVPLNDSFVFDLDYLEEESSQSQGAEFNFPSKYYAQPTHLFHHQKNFNYDTPVQGVSQDSVDEKNNLDFLL